MGSGAAAAEPEQERSLGCGLLGLGRPLVGHMSTYDRCSFNHRRRSNCRPTNGL
jgi:hypothetical protein